MSTTATTPAIHLREVKSSQLAKVGYDAGSRRMAVEFKNGDQWVYAEVSPAVYSEVVSAPSIGKAFARLVRGNHTGEKIK